MPGPNRYGSLTSRVGALKRILSIKGLSFGRVSHLSQLLFESSLILLIHSARRQTIQCSMISTLVNGVLRQRRARLLSPTLTGQYHPIRDYSRVASTTIRVRKRTGPDNSKSSGRTLVMRRANRFLVSVSRIHGKTCLARLRE